MTRPKTIICGLDGGHFELLDPWLQKGNFPNISRVVKNGVAGDLNAVLPPVTSPNWKAYLTGKNPGKLGIFWWENIDVDTNRVYYPSERKQRNIEFWELLADSVSVGLLGVPTTYPPKDIDNGFVISGAPDGDNSGYTYPPSHQDTLEDQFDYRVIKKNRIKDDPSRAAEEILELIDLRFRVATELLEEYDVDFQQVTTFYLNALQHFLWDHDYTKQAWKRIDYHVGDFLDRGYNVVLMSDHGSNEIETVFHINSWLHQEGYLKYDMGLSSAIHQLGVNTDRLKRIAGPIGVKDRAQAIVPDRIISHIPDEQGGLKREQKTENVDWENTEALASGQGPVYLTADPDTPRYEMVRSELIERLETLTDPRGRPVADAVYRAEDIYDGPYVSEGPDLVIDQAKAVHIPGDIGRDEVFSDPSDGDWRAENKRAGMFAAAGPSFGTGDIDELSILDLAPTFLHLYGQPVPDSMDGEVRKSVFAEDTEPRKRSVSYTQSDGRRQTEIERIRDIAGRIEL
jgi:predicted AlkP superfamily phosphohydrolase/phosphomutase